ncbi:hypothetical protein PNOK_0713300 [Pyrrhoderma noxium]|uniref:Uncharacterized protein n=1 Tax=Pyrrhoderma noxium TaxID=2282107 RepID=A0A286UBZ6_9AGAM|nr:hypothetical protein PNOK_0713300 [Pyrrhoderma noxium]
MFFTRVASFLTFTLALGSSAIASPVAAPKVDLAGRSTDVTPAFQSVFTNLKTTTNVVLPQLQTIAANQNGTSLDVALLVNQMVVALNTAHAQVLSIPVNAASTVNADSVSDDLADTINNIVSTLGPLNSALPGVLAGVTSSVDLALSGLMSTLSSTLGDLIPDLLNLVTGLLSGLLSGDVLSGLGLGDVLGLLTGLLGGL